MNFSILQRNFRSYLVLAVFLTFSACANGQVFKNYDLTTKDGVFKALEAETGKEYDRKSRGCLKRPKELPNIILIGGFAHDRGCILTEAFVDKRYVNKKDNLSEVALKFLGWEKADSDKRAELALNWVKNGLLVFGNPLDKATEHFNDSQKFEKPTSSKQKDDSIKVTLWIKHSAGMVCEDAYSKVGYNFSSDGKLIKRDGISSFRIPCE